MKPFNIPTKEFIISERMNIDGVTEKEINSVVTHQFENMVKHFIKCNSLELSGFGKFVFNERKAIKKLKEYDKIVEKLNSRFGKGLSLEEEKELADKIEAIKIDAELLKTKIK